MKISVKGKMFFSSGHGTMSPALDGDKRGNGGASVDQGLDLTLLVIRFSVLAGWAHRSEKMDQCKYRMMMDQDNIMKPTFQMSGVGNRDL